LYSFFVKPFKAPLSKSEILERIWYLVENGFNKIEVGGLSIFAIKENIVKDFDSVCLKNAILEDEFFKSAQSPKSKIKRNLKLRKSKDSSLDCF
jgi:hypothetical protein